MIPIALRGLPDQRVPRVIWLYGRSRGFAASVALVVVACLGYALTREWAHANALLQAAIVQALPALAASVIGVSAWSPFGEAERTAALPVARLRMLHIGILSALAALLTLRLLAAWTPLAPQVDLGLVAVRNLAGFAGAALVVGRVVDARLSWLAPFVIAMGGVAWLVVASPDRLWAPPWWLWSVREPGDAAGWLAGGALAVAGLVVFARSGPRDAVGEEG